MISKNRYNSCLQIAYFTFWRDKLHCIKTEARQVLVVTVKRIALVMEAREVHFCVR
jgi:hypothetical protein